MRVFLKLWVIFSCLLRGICRSVYSRMDESPEDRKTHKSGSRTRWFGTPSFLLLCNFLLSQWGDWMWQFSAGLYLVHLSDGQLRLAAVFGFTGGTCVLLFGGIIGDWVDRNERLNVVRVSLFIQNISVALSAASVCTVLALEPSSMVSGYPVRYLMEIAIVVLAVVAQLASVAYKIAIEKDWIIVIAAGKSSTLSNLNAITRSLDLLCKILSPLTVGFIMSQFSMFASACVIAAWNVTSVFVEYALLSRIYYQVPQLARKGVQETEGTELKALKEQSVIRETGDENFDRKTEAEKGIQKQKEVETQSKGCLARVFEPFLVLVTGWKIYARQSVVFAGISLACLYMTVLGFDSITLGYIYANDVSEFMVGVCMALAGVTGIIGTFSFTLMAKRCGLERTGVFAFLAELSCLVLAVASVWAPGSKFDLRAAFGNSEEDLPPSHLTSMAPVFSSSETSSIFNINTSTTLSGLISNPSANLSSKDSTLATGTNSFPYQNVSMILLLVGIIMSRIGLWMADLVVTQVMQESIVETERGIVNGVQNSLNMLMDMLKFALVIFLPQIQVFGLHIVTSFAFISAGAVFFCVHVVRSRRSKDGGTDVRKDDNDNAMVVTVEV